MFEALKAAGPLKGTRFLLPRADIAREVLRRSAARRRAPRSATSSPTGPSLAGGERDGDHDIYRMLLDRQIDAVTFTSASTVTQLRAACSARNRPPICCNTTVVAAIGPVTAEAAQQLGIRDDVMPKHYTIPDLVDALVEHFSSSPAAAT